MILHRCFAWDPRARDAGADGPLWVPRPFQGEGRHDNPDLYGCLYLSERPVSCIVEQLARFRGQRLTPPLLVRRGLPLALAALQVADEAVLVDLDDPAVLRRERLRPSTVATRERPLTQAQARGLYGRHAGTAGLRWWSTHEALWMNVTLFDRAVAQVRVLDVHVVGLDDPAIAEAVQFLGLQVRSGAREA